MSRYTTDDLTLDESLEASEALEERTRRAVENASTQELLELIRLRHALQTDPATAVATLRAANVRRAH